MWSQPEGAEEPQTNISVSQQEEQTNAAEGKVIADYEPDVDYKPEGSEPKIKPVKEVEENSDAEYLKLGHFARA